LPNPYALKNSWRILPLTIADQQRHIERSEMLLSAMAAGDPPTLFWSMAESQGLVLGFSQQESVLNSRALAALRLPIYHRRAGGTAVLVGPHLLGLDVALPPDHPLVLPDLVESYRWLGEAWAAALAQFGIQARAIPPVEAHEQRALLKRDETRERESILCRSCYGAFSPYEVVVGQRKVVGLDMIRRRTGSLLQAGVLLHWKTETLAQLLGHTPEEQTLLRDELLERAAGLDTLAGRSIAPQEVIAAFQQVLNAS
jgi:lipoate---protein ligase